MNKIDKFLEKTPGNLSGIISIILVGIAVLYWSLNANPAPCMGIGDCVKYSEMTRMFSGGIYGAIEYPFNLRVMAPWLVSKISSDVTNGFIWLNAASAVLFATFCFLVARKLRLPTVGYLILLCWFFLHPLGFHFYYAIPVSADPLSYALMGLIAYLFLSKRTVALWLFVLIALFAKESFVFIVILVAVAEAVYLTYVHPARSNRAVWSIVAAVLVLLTYSGAKGVLQANIFPQTQGWEITTLSTIRWWVNEAMNDPNRLIVWAAAFFCAIGVLPILAIGDWKLIRQSNPEQARSAAYFGAGGIGFVILGLLAGSDMSRIIFNGNFFTIPFLLIVAGNRKLSVRYITLVFAFSMAIAMSYTYFFPSAIEYAYYDTRNISNLAWFVVGSSSIMIFLWVVMRLKCWRRCELSEDFERNDLG